MNELVFLEPSSVKSLPFTTSDVIAEYAQIKHHAVQQVILKHEDDLKEFGTVAFEMRACRHKTGASMEKIYHLTEEQATLLITYLKNTEPVRRFKKELVRQFYEMKTELIRRQVNREERKPIRRSLTDSVKDNPDKGVWSYKLYTDLCYKAVVGKTASQLRKERGAAPKANATDFLTADELSAVSRVEGQVAVLHDMGMEYEQIKQMVVAKNATAAT